MGHGHECSVVGQNQKINKLLHNNSSSKVVFNDICDVLKDILASNILVISKKRERFLERACVPEWMRSRN